MEIRTAIIIPGKDNTSTHTSRPFTLHLFDQDISDGKANSCSLLLSNVKKNTK